MIHETLHLRLDDNPLMQRRHLLPAALAASALLPLGCSAAPAATPATPIAPKLLPLAPQITPEPFLTVTSRERDADALASLVSDKVLPLLAPADIAHAAGPVEGPIQLWLMLNTADLQHNGLDVNGALALLKDMLKGCLGLILGRNRLEAWAIDIPGQKTVDAQRVTPHWMQHERMCLTTSSGAITQGCDEGSPGRIRRLQPL